MRILLVGQNGQVAFELRRTLACLGEVISAGRSSQPVIDLLNPGVIGGIVRDLRPDLIINAAAYTQVDLAEIESEAALTINRDAVKSLAQAAAKIEIPLVHFSTDYVFDGQATIPYKEDDPKGPRGVYATSKLEGEEKIRDTGVSHWILRTAWVYSLHGQNFLKTMLRLMAERESLAIVNDQRGAPTWSRMIAEATSAMLARSIRNGKLSIDKTVGTYHLTAQGETTWFGFAEKIREIGVANAYLDQTAAQLLPITTKEYPTPAQRPSYSVLDNNRLGQAFDIQLPDWEAALRLCLEETKRV